MLWVPQSQSISLCSVFSRTETPTSGHACRGNMAVTKSLRNFLNSGGLINNCSQISKVQEARK